MKPIKLMYITNQVRHAALAIRAGVDRIFVDLETVGKEDRQGGLDTVKSDHSLADVLAIRQELTDAEILVRINPLGPYSKHEVDEAISSGANLLMLPMFTTSEEVKALIDLVQGRAKISLLLETPQALVRLPDYLRYSSYISEVHVGLNDLHLGMELDFMFELLAGGVLDLVSKQLKDSGVRFGFGGIARVGYGDIPAEDILLEHVRLGSEVVILSRAFHGNLGAQSGVDGEVAFTNEVAKLRKYEAKWRSLSMEQLDERSEDLRQRIFGFARSRRAT